VPREQASLLQLLIERVDYDPKEVAITFRPTGIASRWASRGAQHEGHACDAGEGEGYHLSGDALAAVKELGR
jgi:hypothetical protein